MAKNRPIPPFALHVGGVLADELKARNMKQADLARLSGIPRSIINEIIKERRGLNAASAIAIGKALDITPESLMTIQVNYEIDTLRIAERDGEANGEAKVDPGFHFQQSQQKRTRYSSPYVAPSRTSNAGNLS